MPTCVTGGLDDRGVSARLLLRHGSYTSLGYAGMLTGPAAIGFLAHATSLPLALGGIAVLLVVVAACAAVTRR